MGKYAIQSNPIAEMQGQRRNTLINDRQQQLFEQSKVEHPLRTEQMKQSNQMGSMKLDDATQQAKIKKEVLFGARLAAFSGGARDAELDRIIQSSIQNNDPDTTKKAQAIKALSAKDQDEMLSKVVQLGEQMNILERDPARAQSAPREVQIYERAQAMYAQGDKKGGDILMATINKPPNQNEGDRNLERYAEWKANHPNASPLDEANMRKTLKLDNISDKALEAKMVAMGSLEGQNAIKGPIAKAQQRAKRTQIIQDFEHTAGLAEELLQDAVDGGFGGLGEVLMSQIKGTDEADFASAMSVLANRMGLTNLQKLKQESSTGSSGLGSTSEREINLLINQVGAMHVGLSPQKKQKELKKIAEYHKRVSAAMRRDMLVDDIRESGGTIDISRIVHNLMAEKGLSKQAAFDIAGGERGDNPEKEFREARAKASMLKALRGRNEGGVKRMTDENLEWFMADKKRIPYDPTGQNGFMQWELDLMKQMAQDMNISTPY